MNAERFRLIYSEVHGEYIPVAEMTHSHLWTIPGISGSRLFPLPGGVLTGILKGLIVGSVALSPGHAQTVITPDGRTQTAVAVTGTVSDVTTATVRSSNAFNSFSIFNVGAGDTVNLHLPAGTQNLINLVRDQQTSIYGILNAIKDGKIGGNVWFANPHGFLVGSTGVVNLGSLTIATPTAAFVDNFFVSANNPDDVLVGKLLAGNAPRSGTGVVTIDGKINAIDGINLSAGTINVGGALYSGARFVNETPTFDQVVNANGLDLNTNVVEREGRILIVADEAVSVTGKLHAPGSATVAAGDIHIQAGGTGTAYVGDGEGAKIALSNAELIGKDITLEADASFDSLLPILPVLPESVSAEIDVDSSQLRSRDGDLTLTATSTVEASTKSLSPIETNVIISNASVDVDGTSVLRQAGAGTIKLSSLSDVTSTVAPGLPNAAVLPADAGVAVNVVVSNASMHIGGSAQVEGDGAVELDAINKVKANTSADSSAKGTIAVGGTVAVTDVVSSTQAYVDGSATVDAASITVAADAQNDLTTSAKAATKGATKKAAAGQDGAASPSKTEQILAKFKTQASTPEAGVDVAAAVAVANLNATTQAYVASTGALTANGALMVSSQALNNSKVVADGSTTTGSVGVGAAVGVNIGVLNNQAMIADNSIIKAKGVTVKAVSPDTKTNTFSTQTTSGAGASNVGVAGSLGANVLVNTTEAFLEGDLDASGTGGINADGGDVLVQAKNESSSTITTQAFEKAADAKQPAQVGVGASVGTNVAVNTTRAEVEDGAKLSNANGLDLNAEAKHTVTTTVKGGASGAKVSVTPVAAVTVGVNTTVARMGAGTALGLTGAYSSKAKQTSSVTSSATGTTQGDNAAIGASLALNTAVDTVTASLERDVTNTGAGNGVSVKADSTTSSSATATASVTGGHKADTATDKPNTGDAAKDKTVDEQVTAQGDAAKKTAEKVPASDKASAAKTSEKGSKLNQAAATKNTTNLGNAGKGSSAAPKAESTEGGGVSVAAAVGVNVGVATSKASIAPGKSVTSEGVLTVESRAQADAASKADGSTVDAAKTNVGVGAAVSLNVGIATNQAIVGAGSHVKAQGMTVQSLMQDTQKNDFSANAKSGAGASQVGVAGALAVNVVVNTSEALVEGESGTTVDADDGDVAIKAASDSASTVTSGATVTGTDQNAKVGVGASIGVNVVVNTTKAEVEDGATLADAGKLTLEADAGHTLSTTVTGGAAGAKVSITPVAAVAVGVNTTQARLGTAATGSDLTGALKVHAAQTDTVTTKATGSATGDVAVGASLAAAVVLDKATASVERDITSSSAMTLEATSTSSLTTTATAGAKGAKAAAKKPGTNEEAPEKGTTVDEQKDNQLKAAAGKNTATANVDVAEKTKTAKSETPAVNKDQNVDKNNPGANKESGKKVSVAAAIGVGVAENQAIATLGAGRTVHTTGDLGIQATTHTNYTTKANGEAVSDNVGVAAAVALTATMNKTQASIGAGTNVAEAGKVSVAAKANQNLDTGFIADKAAEAVSGASGGDIAVAGALAVVANDNETRASIDEGATLGSATDSVGDVTVTADEASRLSAQARAGALSKGSESKAGVGASFAVLLSNNRTTAAVGYGASAPKPTTIVYANSLTVTATKHAVVPTSFQDIFDIFKDTKSKDYLLNLVDPSTYLSQVNYYTEAVAGAAAKGDAAVSGAFSVNVFGNTTEAYLQKANVVTDGAQSTGEKLGVEVASRSEVDALSMAGAVAGAKKAGVGISNTDIIDLDQVVATVDGASKVTSSATGAGVKVGADADKDLVNLSVSAGIGTQSTGVAGVLGVVVSLNKAQASIADQAIVKSKGNMAVQATNDNLVVMTAGGIGGGKDAGVGASMAVNVVAAETSATIGKDAEVDASQSVTVGADADEKAITVVVAGSGASTAAVSGALSVNTIVTQTQASIGEGARVNTDAAYASANQAVALSAQDDTVVVGVGGGLAGAGKVGVGAALDTTVLAKTVKAFVADDTTNDGKVATIKGEKQVALHAGSTEDLVSVTVGFGGGGNTGVGGAVSIGVVKNDVQAYIGSSANVDSDGNVLVNAEDDVTAVLTAGGAAGGGTAGVGGSLAVATLLGSTKAFIGDDAQVNARGNEAAASVYSGETAASLLSDDADTAKSTDFAGRKKEDAKGLSVTAYNREKLITTAASGAGGGSAGVAATVSGNVIASTTEAYIGRSAEINKANGLAGAEQQVRVKAMDETLLVNTAAGAGGGGSAGVGAAANVGVVAKHTKAWIGTSTLVKAKQAVEVDASSAQMTFTTTVGFAGGGSAGVGGSVGAIGVANTTEAFIEDARSAPEAAQIDVTGGSLAVQAEDLATSWLLTGSGAGGGAAGVGGSLAVGVNSSTTKAKIGSYAETHASGTTSVKATSTENVNSLTVAGAGGGSAGVAGAISAKVIVSRTEAGIGDHAKVNQGAVGQDVTVEAKDRIIAVGIGGSGAGGGAAGVGGTADVTVALNTTSAYIGQGVKVSAAKDVKVDAASEKYVNSATIAGAGGGAAGVAGAVSVISVGSLLDGEAQSGLQAKETDASGKNVQSQQSSQGYADGQTTKSAVGSGGGNMLGDTAQADETKLELDQQSAKLAISGKMNDVSDVPLKNTQAFIGPNAVVSAGEDVHVSAQDKTLAIVAAGSGAGGGAAGVAGAMGIVLLHDSAEAFIADGAQVDAKRDLTVDAGTRDDVYNVAITGSGAGAADVSGTLAVNVVTSDTAAYVGDAEINQHLSGAEGQSVSVNASSSTTLVTAAGSGGGAGAASVGGIATTNVLGKTTKAYFADGADVRASKAISTAAASKENIISGAISIRGAGAAAVSGAVSANVVDNTTEAFIGSGAVVDSDGNAKLEALDDTLIVSASAVGNGAGAAAVGGNAAANVISSRTKAYVEDHATVNARGNADGMAVLDGGVGATAGALPGVPGDQSGSLDFNGDGKEDGNLSQGASFNLTAGDGTTKNTSQGVDGKNAGAAAGGLSEQTRTTGVKGLAITATANEKIVSTVLSVAGSGATSVTGSASVSVVKSETAATIGDGVKVNDGLNPGGDVRLTAADHTLLVQVGGAISGSGVAAVSGAGNVGVITKKTQTSIGDSDVKARNIDIQAISGEDVHTIGANVSVAGAAGVGGAVGVDVVKNETTASIGAGAEIDATGNLAVEAEEDTRMDLYTVSGTGGLVGVSGALSVGVIDNTTKAYVEGNSDPGKASVLKVAGNTAIEASSSQDINTVTVSASGGGVGIAGGVAVKILKSETTAFIGENTQVNPTLGASTQNVTVSAEDTSKLSGVSGGGAIGAYAVGAVADVNIIRNTTAAYVGDSAHVNAGGDVVLSATSSKDVQASAIAASGGLSGGIAGSVSLAIVGAELDSTSQESLGSGKTAGASDGQETVSGQLGSSAHLQGMKHDLAATKNSTKVSEDLNQTSVESLDKTRAYIGKSAHVTTGGAIEVTATDQTDLDLLATSVAVGSVGLGGAVGVGLTNSTTEAFIDSSSMIDADGDVTVHAKAENLDAEGSTVQSIAGAGGIVGATAVVAVMKDTSHTEASIKADANIQDAATLMVKAETNRKSASEAIGTTVGGLAIGASISRTIFDGATSSSMGSRVHATVDGLVLEAEDSSTAKAKAIAGSAGILSGSGADAEATVSTTVDAHTDGNVHITANDDASVQATGKASTSATAWGVNAGLAAVGVSKSSASVTSDVTAQIGENNIVQADHLSVSASTALPTGGTTASADSKAASGGLIGINGALSNASYSGSTHSHVGKSSTIIGSAFLDATTDTRQTASASGIAVGGLIAVGASTASATSTSNTEASFGDEIAMTGAALGIAASGTDENYADATAGSGGLIAGAASSAKTETKGTTRALVGNGSSLKDKSLVAGDFNLSSQHTSKFNSRTDSVNASLVGASGARSENDVSYSVESAIGENAVVKALSIDVDSVNRARKEWLSSGGYNVEAGSGGLIGAAAARSETDIALSNETNVGRNADLEVIGDRFNNPGLIRMDGFSEVVAYDRAKLDSGGAIAVAKAESIIRNQNDAENENRTIIDIGPGASLKSVGDIDLATRTNVDVQTSANAKTYGAAGAAEGDSESRVVTRNTVTIQSGVSMLAYGDINLRAGSNSSGNTNQSTVLANTDLWNKTAFPVETKPEANAYFDQSDYISLGGGSWLQSAGNMRLLAEKGDASVRGYGVGKDLYREVLAAIGSFFSNLFGGGDVSLDIKGGSSTNLANTGVRVDGQVDVGINNKQYLYIKADGSLDEAKTSEGITVTTSNENLSNSIQDRIDELDALITQMKNQTGTASTSTNPQAQAEIDNLNSEKSGKNNAYTELGTKITQATTENQANQQIIQTNNTVNIPGWQAAIATLDKNASDYAQMKAYYEGLIANAQSQNLTLQGSIDTNNTVYIPDWNQRRSDIQTRIGQINQRIAQLQATLGTDDGGTGVAGLLQKYEAEKAMLEFQLAGLGDTTNVGVISVDQEIVARSSNIYVKADNFTGTGALHAPGDTLIEIKNESANFLRTNKMTIPDEAGGKIYYNSIPVSSVEAINARNASEAAHFSNNAIITSDTTKPEIRVISSYIPYGTERAPDVFVDGDIRNLNGSVVVTNTFGSVLVKDGVDIVADTISLSAGRDITIGYKDGFRNVGGDVEHDWSGVIGASETGGVDRKDYRTPEEILGITGDQDPSILAGNNVFIAGQYLNINGIVQSGLPLRSLTIPASLASEIAAYKAKYDAKDPSATERIYKGLSLNTGIESDISKVAVFYDAKDDVLELAPVTIMGGYMELYGHVMNTGTGELRVMDGYGTIDIKNDTGYQLRVKTLNTGNGIEGTIKITDTAKSTSVPGTPLVTVIKRLGNDIRTFDNSSGTLDMGTVVSTMTGRSTTYDPLANQYYSWTTLDHATWTESQNYYRERWFGFTTSTEYSWGGSYGIVRQPQVRVSAAVPRVIPGHTESYWYDRTYYLDYSGWSSDYSWHDDVWALLYIKDHQVYTRSASETILHNHNIAAFNPINIKFLGNDTGLLSVQSAGGLIIDGQVKNTLGTTTLTSTTGSILRGTSEESRIIGQNMALNAATGIGSLSSPVSINLVNAGVLDANVTVGDLNLENPSGSLVYGAIKTGDGNVALRGESGIYGASSGALITGNLVALTAEHGGIGTQSAPVQVETLASSSGGLSTLSAADQFITETTGDLYLVKAESTGGNVNVTASGGRLLDNNNQETRDTRAEDKLAALYDDMLLKGDKARESADATVHAFELGKEREYATYWKYRVRQQDASGKPLASDAYHADARIRLTEAERAYYETTLKWSVSEIEALESKMTSEFHALHTGYGSIGNSFHASWTYSVERPVDGDGKAIYDSAQYDASRYQEWDRLIAGHSWTQSQLDNSISAGALKEVSDTETRIEEANAKGRDISLSAGGAIGHDTAPITIKLDHGRTWSDLTKDEKVALMAAERDDIEIISPTEVKITQREDVDIEAQGALTVQSVGNAYLGSEKDIHVASIDTHGGNLRLKGQQAITGALAGTVITARDAILEAGDHSIGASIAAPLVVNLSGALTARVGDSMFIRQAAGDMKINNLYAVHDIHLDSPGSILAGNGTPALDVRSENLDLKAVGSIGSSGSALDVGLDATGALVAEAGMDAFINSPSRGLRITRLLAGGSATVTSQLGILDGSSTSLTVDGTVTAHDGITLETGGRTVLSTRADVHSTDGAISLQADVLDMDDDGQDAARLRTDAGTIAIETLGDATITGLESGNGTARAVEVTSFAGRILDGGDTRLDIIADTRPAAKLTLQAAFGIGDDPLEVRVLDLNASSGGGIGIAAEGPVNVEALSAADRILLTATGPISGGSIISTGTGTGHDQNVTVASIGGAVDLDAVAGRTSVSIHGGTDVSIGTVTGDAVTISAPGNVTVTGNTVNVGSFLQLFGNRIQAGIAGGNHIVGGSIGGFGGGVASDVRLTLSTPSGFAFTNFWAMNANVNIPNGWLSSRNTLIGNRAVFTNPVTLMLVDQFRRRVQPCDVQLYSGLSPFSFKLAGNRVDTNAFVIYRDPFHETITPSGNNKSVVEQSGDALAQSQAGQAKKKQKKDGESSGDALPDSLITYAGFPVSLEGE